MKNSELELIANHAIAKAKNSSRVHCSTPKNQSNKEHDSGGIVVLFLILIVLVFCAVGFLLGWGNKQRLMHGCPTFCSSSEVKDQELTKQMKEFELTIKKINE